VWPALQGCDELPIRPGQENRGIHWPRPEATAKHRFVPGKAKASPSAMAGSSSPWMVERAAQRGGQSAHGGGILTIKAVEPRKPEKYVDGDAAVVVVQKVGIMKERIKCFVPSSAETGPKSSW
jgi:hypothetical protein